MQLKRISAISLFVLILCISAQETETLEPITTGIAVGTAIIGSAFLATFDKLKCKLYECCEDPWINGNFSGLRATLSQRLHGQHLVVENTVKSLKRHWTNPDPQKALVLSFHGWTGGGKNFVSRIVSEHLYKQGMESRFVHLLVSTLHFPHKSKLETYKDQLRDWIRGNVSYCGRSTFIFDEVDKMPESLIDTIKPYLDHYPEINGVDYRKSIFIFLSNTAGNDITKFALQHWKSGKQREELIYKDLEEVMTVGAFNENGGLWHSSLIDKNLISMFLPFLPLERKHVKKCIADNMKTKGYEVNEDLVSQVADELQYFPKDTKLYSKSGCKRVSEKVDLIMEDLSDDL